MEKIKDLAKSYQDYNIKMRRYFHENPETSGKEFETSKLLQQEFKSLGCEIVKAEGTGFIAIYDTGRPGKTIGFRADIDALPMDEGEENLKEKKVVISKVKGAAHTCGHDGHMSIALTVGKIINDLKDELSGKVIFILEEGEESGSGIGPMLDVLKNYEIDMILGNHLSIMVDTGKFSLDPGPRMAGNTQIEFIVKGKGGHSSRPDLSINPIFAAANIVSSLGNAWINQLNSTKTVTMAITQLHGGTVFNIIPEEIFVSGGLRFFDLEEGMKAKDIVENFARLIGEANKCEIEFTENNRFINEPVVNDEKWTNFARKVTADIYGEDSLVDGITWFASESFSAYNKIAPIVFNFVGTRNEDKGIYAEHHNVSFDIDEEALYHGAIVSSNIIAEALKSE